MNRTKQIGALVFPVLIVLVGTSTLQAETSVLISPGTYALSEIITMDGTPENWVRYSPAEAGTVVIQGGRGGVLKNRHYVVLDGFIVDGTLDEKYPDRLYGLEVDSDSSNVHIVNTLIGGGPDIHTGYDALGNPDCSESNGFPTTWSVGLIARGTNITLENVVVHGFYDGAWLSGTSSLFSSLIRNNFNGVSITGAEVVLDGNVFWVNPNHGLEASGAGLVEIRNNLIVDAQEMFMVWDGGVDQVVFEHNTFYIPANKPCFGMEGIHARTVTSALVARDNILVNKRSHWIDITYESPVWLASDFNLLTHYEIQSDLYRDEFLLFGRDPSEVLHSVWNAETGQDTNSLLYFDPQFVDPPQYEDFDENWWGFRAPSTVAEARSWFALADTSPARAAGSDGLDIGILPVPTATAPAAPQDLVITN